MKTFDNSSPVTLDRPMLRRRLLNSLGRGAIVELFQACGHTVGRMTKEQMAEVLAIEPSIKLTTTVTASIEQ